MLFNNAKIESQVKEEIEKIMFTISPIEGDKNPNLVL